MEQFIEILNSPIGLLVTGAIISGLFVQYITSKWQQRNWLFQQRFTTQRTKFEKELLQKYKVLEDINGAVATILTYCQMIVVGYMKRVSSQQRKEEIINYNEAVMKWETEFRIYMIRLKTIFEDKEIPELWNTIKKERDYLDVALYTLTSQNQGLPEDSLLLIEDISNITVDLSQHMLTEINKMKNRPFGDEA
jgi:hypothetical protein